MKRQFLLLSLLVASCITQAGDGGFFDTTGEILGLAAVVAVTWGFAHKNQLTNNAQRVWTQSVTYANSAKNVVSSSVRDKTSSLKSWFAQKLEKLTERNTVVRTVPYDFSPRAANADDANRQAQQPAVGAAAVVDPNLAAAASTPLPSASTSGLGLSADNDSTSTASSFRSQSPAPGDEGDAAGADSQVQHLEDVAADNNAEGSDTAVVDPNTAASVGVVNNNSANAQTQQHEAPVNNQVVSTKLAEPRGSYFTFGDRCIYGAIVVIVFAAIIAGRNKVPHAAQLAL